MPARYPALRAFARGYLHEDFEAEHGSAEAALEAFLADASPVERRALARDAARLHSQLAGLTVALVRQVLHDELGCAWSPARASEARTLLAKAAAAAEHTKH